MGNAHSKGTMEVYLQKETTGGKKIKFCTSEALLQSS